MLSKSRSSHHHFFLKTGQMVMSHVLQEMTSLLLMSIIFISTKARTALTISRLMIFIRLIFTIDIHFTISRLTVTMIRNCNSYMMIIQSYKVSLTFPHILLCIIIIIIGVKNKSKK